MPLPEKKTGAIYPLLWKTNEPTMEKAVGRLKEEEESASRFSCLTAGEPVRKTNPKRKGDKRNEPATGKRNHGIDEEPTFRLNTKPKKKISDLRQQDQKRRKPIRDAVGKGTRNTAVFGNESWTKKKRRKRR